MSSFVVLWSLLRVSCANGVSLLQVATCTNLYVLQRGIEPNFMSCISGLVLGSAAAFITLLLFCKSRQSTSARVYEIVYS